MWCTGKETGRSASNSFLKTRGFLVFKIRSDKSRKQCLGATQPRFRLLWDSPNPESRTGFWPRILQMLCWVSVNLTKEQYKKNEYKNFRTDSGRAEIFVDAE